MSGGASISVEPPAEGAPRVAGPSRLAKYGIAAAFLAQNLLMVYSLGTMMDLVPGGLDPYLLGIGALEAIGLGAMLWTATR